MIKKNSRGFILLELLVAIFIFTIVIFVGYKIIDKSTIVVKDQGNINKGQLTMNNMNNYITKDLEQSSKVTVDVLLDKNTDQEIESYKSNDNLSIIDDEFKKIVSKPNENKKIVYKYTIKSNSDISNNSGFDDKKIISQYSVSVTLENNNNIYSINRKDYNNIEMNFVSKDKLKELNAPFTIKGSNPYEVSMQYNGKNNKTVKHEFEVTSRYLISSNDNGNKPWEPIIPIPPKPDEIPEPPGFENYGAVVYWIADASKCVNNNLYTWISDKQVIKGEAYGNQKINETKCDIKGNLRPKNEGSNESSSIGYMGDWRAHLPNDEQEFIEVNKNVLKISIYVSPYTRLEVSNFKTQGNGNNSNINIIGSMNENGNQIITGGTNKNQGIWYECQFNKNLNNIDLDGKISIDKSMIASGYVLVVYGDEY